MQRRKKDLEEAWFVSTLKHLCEQVVVLPAAVSHSWPGVGNCVSGPSNTCLEVNRLSFLGANLRICHMVSHHWDVVTKAM